MRKTSELLSKTDIPEGQRGDWRIARFEISEPAARLENLHLTINGYGYRYVEPGTFTSLTYCGGLVTSDTRAELRDHFEPVQRAQGQVLINGLGLGIVTEACLKKPEVEHVTVIEISENVIALVKPYLEQRYDGRLAVIHADALTWQPPRGVIYDVVWHDIWNNICLDNWETMTKLHRRYGKRCRWQGSWCRCEVQRLRKLGR